MILRQDLAALAAAQGLTFRALSAKERQQRATGTHALFAGDLVLAYYNFPIDTGHAFEQLCVDLVVKDLRTRRFNR